MNLIEPNNNQMELEFAGQMVERHDVQAPGLLEVSWGYTRSRDLSPKHCYLLRKSPKQIS